MVSEILAATHCLYTNRSNSWSALESSARIISRRENLQASDHRVRRPPPTPLLHLFYQLGFAREEGFDGAVPTVPNPTFQTQLGRILDGPVPIENALHSALYHSPHLQTPKLN